MAISEKEFLSEIEKHKGIIHKISKMYMDNEEDREDLFQEIILQLWKTSAQFKGASKFSTWMYRVALNTALVFFKKEKKKLDKTNLTATYDIADEPYSNDKEIKLEYFYKAVQELNSVEKALIFLFLEGLSHREIADNLGISEVNARVKLNRTKEKLQLIIKNKGYEF